MVTDMQKTAQQSNGNINTQQFQQFLQFQAAQQTANSQQLPALFNMFQQVAAQQKTLQQQQQTPVPLPSNTTITPVSRQTLPSASIPPKPVNYPQPKPIQQTKQTLQNASSTQARKNVPAAATGSASIPNIPSVATASSHSNYKGAPINAHSNYAAKAQVNPHFPVSKPSLTITKTSLPQGSGPSLQQSVPPKPVPVTTNTTALKPPNPPQATQLTVNTNLNKPTAASTPPISTTPQNVLPSAPQKTSPKSVSPRTKQTPRKNSNPIKAAPVSLAAVPSTTPVTTAAQTEVKNAQPVVTQPAAPISQVQTSQAPVCIFLYFCI